MKNYGVLKGSARKFKRDDDNDPHTELLVEANGTKYRIAINVRSSRGPVAQRLVEYAVIDDLRHPAIDSARALPLGWSDLRDGKDDGAALDYIRSNLFRAGAPSACDSGTPVFFTQSGQCPRRTRSSFLRALCFRPAANLIRERASGPALRAIRVNKSAFRDAKAREYERSAGKLLLLTVLRSLPVRYHLMHR
jgi:hypothetical protein